MITMKSLVILLFTLSVSSYEKVSLNVKGRVIFGRKLFTKLEKKPFVVFRNIPYAEPPLGILRFKPPKVKYWLNGSHDYSDPRESACTCCYNEDCLYLSVFMPISNNQTWNLPVIVWLEDNHYLSLLRPDFLLEEEIVVVFVTHRSLIFGFLNTADEFAEGNMGAKDIIQALRWIKNHIGSFDGDPNTITVVGFKSTAVLVSSVLLTPLAKDLFTRAIILGGSALSPADYRNHNFKTIDKLNKKMNGPFEKLNRTKLKTILRNYSTSKLLLASENLYDSTEVRDSQRLINAFGPSIEISSITESFMNRPPLDVYKSRHINKNEDVMMGFTSLESIYKLKDYVTNRHLLKFLNYNFQYLVPFEGTKDEYGSRRYRKIRQKIMEFYFVNGTIGERSLRRYAKYVSDQVIYPLLRQARLQADASSGNVYLYRFAFKGALNIAWNSSAPNLNWAGATSGDEICYLFRCKSVNDVYNSAEVANERHFIKKTARLLANFAKYGDPTPDLNDDILGDLSWEPLTSGMKMKAMNLDRKIKMVALPEEERMNFWDQLKSEFYPETLPKDEL